MAIIHHAEASSEERVAYLRMANAVRRGEESEDDDEEKVAAIELSQKRYAQMGAAEQFILTLTERGYGKRTSSYEYRITGRGGKGIVAMKLNKRIGRLVASFPVEEGDQIMLVTDGGKLIRTPVAGIRIAGRATQGVIVFDTAEDERVVSVERISEEEDGGNG
jgi:DNA gyrase subunit A